MIWRFLGWLLAFAALLFGSMFLGAAGLAVIGGGTALALLTMLLVKLNEVGDKLDRLLEEKEKE